MRKAAGTGSHRRKVISAPDYSAIVTLTMSDGMWERLRAHLPDLASPQEAKLRADIDRCCGTFLTRCRALRDGGVTAKALSSPGKRQPSSLEKLAKGLRLAADAWAEMRGNAAPDYASRTSGKLIDDRLGPLSDLDPQLLEALARDADRRLKAFRDTGEPVTMAARPELIRAVYKSLGDAGLTPTRTKRVYVSADAIAPTWFQKFMAVLNDTVLGIDGWGALSPHELPAFYSEIAEALR